jgi:hypothetical protein
LLEIPHFGRSLEIDNCVKLLFGCVHGENLWLNPPISIKMQLISWIMGLSTAGEDLKTLFTNKDGEKALSESMKQKFKTFIGK